MNKNKTRISPPYILLRALYQDSRESYGAFGKMEFSPYLSLAVCDGFHLARFVNELQEAMNTLFHTN
jgi:hypothetical protein